VKSLFAVLGAAALVVGCTDNTAPGAGGGGTPDSVAANLGTMAVGDVRVLTFSAASGGLHIPAANASAQYALVVSNVAINSGNTPSYTVRGDRLAPQINGPVGDYFPPISGPTFRAPASENLRGSLFEASLRRFERDQLPRPGGTMTSSSAAADRMPPLPSRATAPPVGTQLTLKVLTPAGFNGENSVNCSSSGYTTTTGTVRAVGTYAIVVSDNTTPANGFTPSDYQAVANEFDKYTYPTDVSYFGTPTDLDNNGHIIIYYTPAVNKLTPAGQASVSGYVGGFFFAGDLYPTTGNGGCASSNRGEIFYLLAPDPSGTFGNAFSTDFVRQVTRGTLAHEFQHMINSGNRFLMPASVPFETTWLDEGLAHFAEGVVGRARAGFGDLQKIDYNTMNALPDSVVQAFFLQNLARAKYYVERPDTTAAIVSQKKAGANLASRGAEWAMLRYLADWFNGNGDPRTLTRKLVAGPDTGTVNLVKSTGAPVDTIFARWLTTMYTDNRAIPNLNPVYNYKSYTMRQLIAGTLVGNEQTSSYLPVKALGNGSTTVSVTVPSSSAAYFLTSLTSSGDRTINIASTDPNGRVYIVRTQ
jgi:hypothetical protein